jgi:hypothetical protein
MQLINELNSFLVKTLELWLAVEFGEDGEKMMPGVVIPLLSCKVLLLSSLLCRAANASMS